MRETLWGYFDELAERGWFASFPEQTFAGAKRRFAAYESKWDSCEHTDVKDSGKDFMHISTALVDVYKALFSYHSSNSLSNLAQAIKAFDTMKAYLVANDSDFYDEYKLYHCMARFAVELANQNDPPEEGARRT